MLPYKTLIEIKENSNEAMYRQLAYQMIDLIRSGTIAPGSVVPSTRSLALILSVHRKTILAAYEELIAEGWIKSIPRKGYQVSTTLPRLKPRSFNTKADSMGFGHPAHFPYDKTPELAIKTDIEENKPLIIINDGFPDPHLAPVDMFFTIYRKLMTQKRFERMMTIMDKGGVASLKASTSTFLNGTRGLKTSSGNVMITRGAQMAIYIAASMLIKPGDKVVVSNPSYSIANALFSHLGAELVRIPVDQNGIDTQQLAEVLENQKIKMLYIVPHHHHPTTVTMDPERRKHLLELINKYSLPVIEDDYDYDFHYSNSPFLPLAASDHKGNVIYIGSFTKILTPSFRVGYMIAPENFLSSAINIKRLIDLRGDTLMEEALSQMIDSGEIERHINRSKKIYAERCDYTCALIKKELSHAISFTKPQGGMALYLKFKEEYPLEQVIPAALNQGLLLSGSAYFSGNDKVLNALRFGFASLNQKDLQKAVEILKKVLPVKN